MHDSYALVSSSKVFNIIKVRVAQVIPAVKEPNGVIQLYSSEKNARDSSSLPELDQILVEPGMETKRTTAAAVQIQHTAVATAWWLINRLANCLEYPKTWLEETRSMLMIVAIMISTTTFQAAVNNIVALEALLIAPKITYALLELQWQAAPPQKTSSRS
ncbi:hypothetical protein Pyn_22253 [Prunus yedoensis var. nudiflora]|uniref:Uncharacterized protein n=1 Tax=Prunus yedoensis var. nudiflora TaxID=2094558 RepID=A0A314XSY7_PRUYE|nr:hypothetical protein Pyn_22253 [Prunus yedoensis var. nudiflora]